MTLCLEQPDVINDDFAIGLLATAPRQPKRLFFYQLDLNQDRLLHVSPAIDQMLGYSPKEVMRNGLKWFVEQIHPDDIKPLNHLADQQSHSPIIPHIRYRFKHKTGHFCSLVEYRCLLRDSNAKPSLLIGRVENV
jgi:PAS domain-containing protein